jgi:two-component system nitrate/nitrite response regulator NarP
MEEKMKVLLVEDTELDVCEFKKQIALCKDITLVGVTGSAIEGFKIAIEKNPDAIILDLELKEGNGIEFVRKVRAIDFPVRPYILITTHNSSQTTLGGLTKEGADHYLVKSTKDYSALQAIEILRIMQPYFSNPKNIIFDETKDADELRDESLKNTLSIELMALGMPDSHQGKKYFVEAIILAIEILRDDNTFSLSKQVLPKIAEKHSSTPQNVERCIRYAIRYTWDNGDQSALQKNYPLTLSKNKGIPSAKNLVSFYANKLSESYAY